MPTIDKIKNSFKENNYKLISTEYKDEKTKLKIVCLKHNHESDISWKNFKRAKNKNCKECQKLYPELKTKRKGETRSKKVTNDVIEDTMIKYDLLIYEDFELDIKPSRTNISFICYYGHKSTVRFDSVKRHIKSIEENKRDRICQICNEDIDELRKVMKDEEFVESKGFKLKERYRENSKLIFVLECKNGHEFEPRHRDSFLRSVKENESENIKCMDCKKESKYRKCYGICKKTLDKKAFGNCKSNIDGLDNHCRNCRKLERETRKNNGHKQASKEIIIKDGVDGKMCQNKDCGWNSYENFYKDSYNSDGLASYCKIHKLEMNKIYQKNNPEKVSKIKKIYRENNKEKIAKNKIIYRENNREKFRKWARVRSKQRRREDPAFKLLGNLRHRIYLAIKNNSKSETTKKLIGCPMKEFMKKIEDEFILEPREGIDDINKFIPMTWDNYGPLWHIDHIKPCALFDLSDPLEQRRCFNFRNMQPMYATENNKKNTYYEYDEKLENSLLEIE